MAEFSVLLLSSYLNVNVLNSNQKTETGTINFLENDASICCLQETAFRSNDTNRLNVKG